MSMCMQCLVNTVPREILLRHGLTGRDAGLASRRGHGRGCGVHGGPAVCVAANRCQSAISDRRAAVTWFQGTGTSREDHDIQRSRMEWQHRGPELAACGPSRRAPRFSGCRRQTTVAAQPPCAASASVRRPNITATAHLAHCTSRHTPSGRRGRDRHDDTTWCPLCWSST